jgi:hypothetical protein
VIGAIAIEGFRRTKRVGERDIGVWPEQIDGVARQAGRLVLGSAYGDCLRPKLRWRGWRLGVLPRALWPSASSAPR